MILFKSLVGSRLHGLANENSDWDYKICRVSPLDHVLSPFRNTNKGQNKAGDEDNCIWELTKLIHLATKANPTVLEALWSTDIRTEYKVIGNIDRPNQWTSGSLSSAWVDTHKYDLIKELLNNKHKFLSPTPIYYAHRGYAADQFKKTTIEYWNSDALGQKEFVKKRHPGATDEELDAAVQSIWHRTPKAVVAYVRTCFQAIDLLKTGGFNPLVTRDREKLLEIKFGFKASMMTWIPDWFKEIERELDEVYQSVPVEAKEKALDLEWMEQYIKVTYITLDE